MKKNTITATFVGKNGSLGYTTGQTYDLRTKVWSEGGIWICRRDGFGECVYDTHIHFLQNWKDVNLK